ncbi:MAG: 2-amino-4-hydroxy-6-hydroxymethyldihydropteridine diphosphokinase [Planctomycetota bacterium]|nr:MAG: 2-amino-4-hydroxy-6-hydroxymethyldihydropteridine diphosphokinase [Planctomycetota bacterium]
MTTPADTTRAAIALGANLGDRSYSIRAALDRLGSTPGVRLVAVSSAHETAALTLAGGDADQPAFLNACAIVQTTLAPGALLGELLAIERALGRTRRSGERWAPRVIDLDLLLYGGTVIDEPGLVVPHPRMHERLFVLEPLAEVAPDAVHPALGRTVRELLGRLRTTKTPTPGGLREPAPNE